MNFSRSHYVYETLNLLPILNAYHTKWRVERNRDMLPIIHAIQHLCITVEVLTPMILRFHSF